MIGSGADQSSTGGDQLRYSTDDDSVFVSSADNEPGFVACLPLFMLIFGDKTVPLTLSGFGVAYPVLEYVPATRLFSLP